MSNRIIPKDMVRAARKAEMLDISAPRSLGGAVRSASRSPANPPPPPPPPPDPVEIERVKLETARAAGYDAGVSAGRTEGHANVETERATLQALVVSLNQLVRDFEQGLADEVLSMSLELSKLIVRDAIKVKPEIILGVIHEAISSLPGLDEQTSIHVNPADATLLRGIAETDKMLAEISWKVIEDSQVERGGCRLETATTEIDATLETRWRRVIAALGRDDAWVESTP
ncbi:MAG: flagellar assembly protein FliH [Betaproteobacteria bacterium]